MRSPLFVLVLSSFVSVLGCKPPNDTSNDKPPEFPSEGCQPWDCGELPEDAPQVMCPDGVTLSGPTGDCVAHGSECAWKVVSCPESAECEADDCGPRPTQPNYLCTDDRTMAGPTGRCLQKGAGCAWEIKSCPTGSDVCPDSECGPAPMLPNWVCPDGETVAGPTGVCQKARDGSCSWEIVECAPVN